MLIHPEAQQLKILFFTYKALNNQAPSYIMDLFVPHVPSGVLYSQTPALLVLPRISKTSFFQDSSL